MGRSGRSVGLLTALLCLVVAGCTWIGEEGPEPFRPPGVTAETSGLEAGAVLFDRDCAWCHGSAGEGTRFGPDLNGPLDGGAYTHFMLETGRMPLADPDEDAVRRQPRYDETEILAIVAHVETFGGTGPSVPIPNPSTGDLAEGADLYLDDCAACHSSTGVGGALTSGQAVPDLRHASAVVTAEAMLVGPGCPNVSRTCGPGEGAMPRFELDDHEVNSIVRYVLYVQAPVDDGGSPIGRIGPVAEGAVALLVGLALLVLLVRWIGTRTGDQT